MCRLNILAAMILGLGCSTTSPAEYYKPALVQRLADYGVSDANTKKILIIGGPGGFGPDTQVTVTANFLIQEIWDTIYQSRPHKTWAMSGFRRLQFYTDSESAEPGVELLVNSTDRCHFEGNFDKGFRCPDINKILGPLLKTEYDKRHNR